MKDDRHNDEERRQWSENDEGLYNLRRSSGQGLYAWVRENRALIDSVIDNILSGRRNQHYLAYPDGRSSC
jgi:hypothetical protein